MGFSERVLIAIVIAVAIILVFAIHREWGIWFRAKSGSHEVTLKTNRPVGLVKQRKTRKRKGAPQENPSKATQ